ncbi:MAG: hypothetical protein EXR39_12405 [Betaproteobacteria bacterium]|nr:hypothetical protein [Betaproteobacteria bacterium]
MTLSQKFAKFVFSAALALTLMHGAAAQSGRGKSYIVQLAEPPAVAYEGGINTHPPTKSAEGEKIDADNPAVTSYREHLRARQNAVLDRVGGGSKLHSYGYVFNGFAAQITEAQAQALAKTPDVLSVVPDEIRQIDTATTPAFLGLSGSGGGSGGSTKRRART